MTEKLFRIIVIVLAAIVFLTIACNGKPTADAPTKYWVSLLCNGHAQLNRIAVSHSITTDGKTVTVKYGKPGGGTGDFTYAEGEGCSVVTSSW